MDNTPLERLKRRIYQKEPSIEDRPEFKLTKEQKQNTEVSWNPVKKKSFFRKNLWFILIGLFILGTAGIFVYLGLSSFSEEDVVFRIEGSEEVGGAEVASWRTIIENGNRVNLENVRIVFHYPEGSLPLEDRFENNLRSEVPLEVIPSRKRLDRTFQARLLGNDGEVKKVRAQLFYQLEGISRMLEKSAEVETTIAHSPVVLNVQAPREVTSGGEMTWSISYKNTSNFDFSNLTLRAQYPEGFSFLSASTPPSQGSNMWGPITLKAGQEAKLEIRGRIQGSADEQKVLEMFLELRENGDEPTTLSKQIASTTIIRRPLDIQLAVNGNATDFIAQVGQRLRYTITYRNNFDQPIDNVEATAQIVGKMVQTGTMQSNGQITLASGQVRWDRNNTSDFTRLAPGASGELWIEFDLRDTFPIQSFADKNFTVQVLSSITSTSPPIGFSKAEITQEADIVTPLATQVSFKRTPTDLSNDFGPRPPVVGQKTIYQVTWHITNTANDLSLVNVKAELPPYASFEGVQKVNFGANGFNYDSATHSLFWSLDKIPATTGVILPTYEAVFRVGITPGQEHVGQVIDIMRGARLVARDAFTGQEITQSTAPVGTDLDGRVNVSRTRVVQ